MRMLTASAACWIGMAALAVCQEEAVTDSLGIELKLVRDGHFLMGYSSGRENLGAWFQKDHTSSIQIPEEEPAHAVFITKPFYLATREVTIAQFRQFVAATGYVTTAEKSGDGITGFLKDPPDPDRPRDRRRFERAPGFTWKNTGFAQDDDHPVVGVSWEDANAFCRWLSEKEGNRYRLPTEAEWEYACGAGSPTFFSFGDRHSGNLNRFGNYADITLEEAHVAIASQQWYVEGPGDGAVFTSPVGNYEPNKWGLYDMHGNVWEWCQDYYHDTYYNRYNWEENNRRPWGRDIDPVNLDQPWNEYGEWRIIKGGGWCASPARCRSSVRSYFEANDGACYLGFRVAMDASGPLVSEARSRHERHEAARAALKAAPYAEWWNAFNDDRTLSIQFSQVPPAEIAPHLPLIQRLTAIDFYGQGRTPAAIMEAVTNIPALRSVRIYNPGTDIPKEVYNGFAKQENLEVFFINEGTTLTPAQVAEFPFLENLRVLGLGNSDTTSVDLAALQDRRFPKLDELDLRTLQSDGTELAYFSGAPLRSVRLRNLTDDGARELGKFPTLETVSIDRPQISAQGLAGLAGLSNLQSIRLSNLSDIQDTQFTPLQSMTSLTSVDLDGSGAGDITAGILAKLPKLQGLSIGSPALTDAGMKHIGSISTLYHHLTITQESQVTDAGVSHLWAPDRLVRLYLRMPEGITGSGFATIGKNLTGLQRVEVSSVDFTDEGLTHLGYLPNLEEVVLAGHNNRGPANVTDSGLLALAEAPKLRKFEIRGENLQITEDGIAAMKAKRPGLEFVRR